MEKYIFPERPSRGVSLAGHFLLYSIVEALFVFLAAGPFQYDGNHPQSAAAGCVNQPPPFRVPGRSKPFRKTYRKGHFRGG